MRKVKKGKALLFGIGLSCVLGLGGVSALANESEVQNGEPFCMTDFAFCVNPMRDCYQRAQCVIDGQVQEACAQKRERAWQRQQQAQAQAAAQNITTQDVPMGNGGQGQNCAQAPNCAPQQPKGYGGGHHGQGGGHCRRGW